jgi:hypothetical protein
LSKANCSYKNTLCKYSFGDKPAATVRINIYGKGWGWFDWVDFFLNIKIFRELKTFRIFEKIESRAIFV